MNAEAVASSMRAASAQQEKAARRLAAPPTPGQLAHRALVAKENRAEDILRIATEWGAELGASEVATALHKVAQCCRRDDAPGATRALLADSRFASLEAAGEVCSSAWTPRQLCHVVWSLATLQADDRGSHALLRSAQVAFIARASEGVPQDLSTVAWALAALPSTDVIALESIASCSLARIKEFCPQDLSICGWAFAKLLYDGRRPLLEQIAVESLPRLPEFGSRNLANLAWAFATAAQRDLDLCAALASACTQRMGELRAQELPITLWSFAAITYPADEVFHAAAGQVLRTVDGMDVSHVCNVAWAYARGGTRHEPLFNVLAEAALQRLDYMEPLHLTNLAWAFASVSRVDEFDTARDGLRHEPLFVGIASAAARKPRGLIAQHCASLLWAFASCTVPVGNALADCIEIAWRHSSDQYTPRHVAGMLWALAKLRHNHAPLCGGLLGGVAGSVDELAQDGPAHLASIVWAAARFESNGDCVPLASAHERLRRALRADVRGLLGALAGTGGGAEISEGRQQNIAATVRALYDLKLPEVGRALFASASEDHVPVGAEAWAAWLCGAADAGDAELQSRIWCALAADYEGALRACILNAAAAQAAAARRLELARAALQQVGDGATCVTAELWQRVGMPGPSVPSTCVLRSPRGECRRELALLALLTDAAACGNAEALLTAVEALPLADIADVPGASLAVGAGGAAMDAAIELVFINFAATSQPDATPVVLVLGCGVGLGALRAAVRLRQLGAAAARIVAVEADALRAAAALNLVAWAGLDGGACDGNAKSIGGGLVEVWIGRGEQVLQRLQREHGSGCVFTLVLGPQGCEYYEEYARAKELGLLSNAAVVVADGVLRPMAPELMWHVCCSGLFDTVTVVPREDDWILVARRATASRDGQHRLCAPSPVMQQRHRADEAKRRTLAWRSRDRLAGVPLTPNHEEAEAAKQAYKELGVVPKEVWPDKSPSGWRVQLLAARHAAEAVVYMKVT